MSLTFDYVTMPPKSQEISQLQTNEMNKLQQENQQLAAQFQTQVKKSSEQTIRRNKAENEELKNEERRRQKQKKKKTIPVNPEMQKIRKRKRQMQYLILI